MHKKISRAFTLIEMVIVITIISILLSLLYGALERAQKYSRRAIAYAELKSIESAFRQFYAHYHEWPTNSVAELLMKSNSPEGARGEDRGMIISREVADLLQGRLPERIAADAGSGENFNPEAIPFFEFSRYTPVGEHDPVNPFKSKRPDAEDRKYRILFDTNGDHLLYIAESPDYAAPSVPTQIVADIAVWTYIPGTRKGRDDEENTSDRLLDERLESWSEFGAK